MIENRHYKLHLAGPEWKCEQVTADVCNADFARCKADKRPLWFTIRRFSNNVGFLLYVEIDNPAFLKRQADYMSKHPAR